MDTSIGIGGADSGKGGGFEGLVDFVVEAEKLGVGSVWSAEAWGMDGVAPLAYVAARTQRMKYGTGILQISARAPSMTAMTAMSMAAITGNRFILGLGVSGPQVVEGLHGVPFAHPLSRLREYIEILRIAFSGEKIAYEGEHYVLPLPGGEGKALRMAQPANPNIPICLGSLGPRALELTGELADGWIGTSFTPETADVYLDLIRAGAARANRSLDGFEIRLSVPTGIADDPEKLILNRKGSLAFQLGAMGSPKTNFYNAAFRRIGFEDAAIEVQRLWNEGRRDEARARVPAEMALQTSLIGTEKMVRERVQKYHDAGVTSLGLQAFGRSAAEKLDVIGAVTQMVQEVSADGSPAA